MDSRQSGGIVPMYRNRRKVVILISVLAVAAMLGAGVAGAFLSSPGGRTTNTTAAVTATQHSAFTYPTTTMQEPGYTNGTYINAMTSNVEYLNLWRITDLYSSLVTANIYDSLYTVFPNGTEGPWLASTYSSSPANFTTWDPVTGQSTHVAWIYNVTLRPGVQWTDWTPSTAANTYTFSNYTNFSLYDSSTGGVVQYSHQYTSFKSMAMNTETVQAADLILTWKIMQSALDYSGSYLGVVNVIPLSNLSVEYMLSAPSATFYTYTLDTPVLPYHMWAQHDWATSATGGWNYTGQAHGYDVWSLGYNPNTGYAPDLIGTGPFMFNGGYGMPKGQWLYGNYWSEYVNPHYFVQYVSSLDQWTPKIYELYNPLYSSLSAAIGAEALGQVDTTSMDSVTPSFIPTVSAMPNTYIYHKPSTSYGYIQINSASSYAPLNNTSFRQALNYATNKAYLSSTIDEGYNVLGQPVVPVSDTTWYNATATQYAFNPSLAISMIKSIPGMKNGTGGSASNPFVYDGKPVSVKVQITVASEVPLGVEALLIIANEWDSIGVPTTVVQESFTTLVSNLIATSYQGIDLGITGIFGDPTGDFFSFYNTAGIGTGFYLGPFSSIQWQGHWLTGTQIDSLMNNYTVLLNTEQNLVKRIALAKEIEGLAALESTMINLGYPVDILPFTNSTFTGIIKDSLPIAAFTFWNNLNVHLKSAVKIVPPTTIPIQLHVGVVTSQSVYFNGNYGNATFQVRNQYGQPVSGATLSIGYSPQGSLLNISSDTGVTNSNGQYTWEFQVLPQNPLIYTNDYSGAINLTAAATKSSTATATYQSSLGWTFFDVSPNPVQFAAGTPPSVVNKATANEYTITVENATGAPVSGYHYTIQSLSGAVQIAPALAGQAESNITSYNPVYGFGNQPTLVMNPLAQPILSGPSAAIVGPDGNIYIANSNGTVTSIMPVSEIGTVAPITNTAPYGVINAIFNAGTTPDALLFNASGYLVVANSGSNNLTVINTANGVTKVNVPLGASPAANALAEDGNFLYVGLANGTLLTINETTWTIQNYTTIDSGVPIEALTWGPSGYLYAADYAATGGQVSVINATNASAVKVFSTTMPVGSEPDAMAFNATNFLYVANFGSNNLTVLDTSNTSLPTGPSVGSVATGTGPTSIAMDASGYLYVTNSGSNDVTVVNDTGSLAPSDFTSIGVGNTPMDAVFNAADGNIYITNSASNNLTLVSTIVQANVLFNVVYGLPMSTVTSVPDYWLNSITGTTNSTGNITVMLSSSPIYSYSANGGNSSSWLFIGDYSAGSPVGGASGYMTIGQMTSSYNSNPINGPEGFGVQQPVELPVLVTNGAPQYKITITPVSSQISYNGATTVMVTVTNTTTGQGVPDFTFDLESQNALGGNRGILANSASSTQSLQAFNPNIYFGSTYLPGLQLTTDSSGVAVASFQPNVFAPEFNAGNFTGYAAQPYADQYLVPFDEFILSAIGTTAMGVGDAVVTSTAMVNNVPPATVAAAYVQGAQTLNGLTIVQANSTYSMYINTTQNTAYGPSVSGVSVSVSVSFGNVSVSSGTSSSAGSFTINYTAPNVSVLTPVTITVQVSGGSTTTQTIYLVPHYVITAPSPSKTKTVSSVPTYMYGIIGIFVVLTVVFAALYATSRGKSGRRPGGGQQPPQEQTDSLGGKET